jgi:hypothetical protein
MLSRLAWQELSNSLSRMATDVDSLATAPGSGPIVIDWRESIRQALPLKPSDGSLVRFPSPPCCTRTKLRRGRRQGPEVLGRLGNNRVQGSGTDHSAVGEESVNSG